MHYLAFYEFILPLSLLYSALSNAKFWRVSLLKCSIDPQSEISQKSFVIINSPLNLLKQGLYTRRSRAMTMQLLHHSVRSRQLGMWRRFQIRSVLLEMTLQQCTFYTWQSSCNLVACGDIASSRQQYCNPALGCLAAVEQWFFKGNLNWDHRFWGRDCRFVTFTKNLYTDWEGGTIEFKRETVSESLQKLLLWRYILFGLVTDMCYSWVGTESVCDVN